ncbi:MAG: serine/threonine protein kinase, partial [Gemmatimonadales bacterium]|nr:serine/threonine protein kinase [Gemmatimonadales bacterium]
MINLGITNQAAVAPYVDKWINRPPDDGTQEEDSELAGFLSQLFQAKVITRNQGRTLLAMLTGGAGAPSGEDPNVGKRFGSFVAEELIGEGAMGKVYRACKDGTLQRDFVVKVFSNVNDSIGMARFRREGDLMTSLDHPNIVKVVGSGQEGQAAFLVLEYFEGPTLAEMLEQRGRFSWKSATRAIKQIAAALAVAHEQGIIHRDIKPHNVLVAPGGMLKVFDFGLAKTVGSQSGGLSQAGEILGSPAYMAPEQWGDHKVDRRADLFALGVIYYLLICGETPFKGRTPADYAWKIREGHYEPIDKVMPELPPGVAQVVTQLLETDRVFRTPTAKRLVADLDRVLQSKSPNIPRLEANASAEGGALYPLVGRASYSVGSDFEANVFLDGNAIFDAHATIERTEAGPLLTCKGPTQVNGKPVEEIVLRDKDQIVFGESTALRYRAGNIGKRSSTRHLDASSEQGSPLNDSPGVGGNPGSPIVISGLVATALQSFAHKTVLLSCFESMDPYSIERDLDRSRRRLVDGGFAEGALDEIHQHGLKIGQERTWKLADALFTTTRENLGRSVEAWITWWFEARSKAPRQLRGPGTRARGELVIRPGDGAPKIKADLSEGEDWVVGRSDDA